jgi:3-methyladenine DNA glycosylase AlkD
VRTGRASPVAAARRARRELIARSRPAGEFDASRYFRGGHGLRFLNVGSSQVRAMAKAVVDEHAGTWSVDDAMAFANALMPDRALEVKGVAIEVVGRYRHSFRPTLLGTWKRWLSRNYASNWATTDAMCGLLIGPLLLDRPALAAQMRAWSKDRNMWVRRASAVALIASLRRGLELDLGYDIAARLHADGEDLVQKAVGWMLREAGKADPIRLERYLRANGRGIPRTTLRYAIERFPEAKRKALLRATNRPARR